MITWSRSRHGSSMFLFLLHVYGKTLWLYFLFFTPYVFPFAFFPSTFDISTSEKEVATVLIFHFVGFNNPQMQKLSKCVECWNAGISFMQIERSGFNGFQSFCCYDFRQFSSFLNRNFFLACGCSLFTNCLSERENLLIFLEKNFQNLRRKKNTSNYLSISFFYIKYFVICILLLQSVL